ncbi:hypothetical protein D1007_03288 [Hordeum vulgare]|nr:hypothetical protein D1007_03288 [Hordeum vulgare]
MCVDGEQKCFCFELYWTKLNGFDEAVKEAWRCAETIRDPFKRIDALFHNAGASLQAWGQRKTGNIKVQMAVVTCVIFRLNKAQDARLLFPLETWLKRTLERSLLGLGYLERTIDRQRSRFRWLREGDANTKFFQVVANERRAKKFIPCLKHGEEIT